MGDKPNQRFGVIMAGGTGERFWPLSRQTRPKQLLPLTHPRHSMLEEAANRLSALIPPDQVYVITGAALAEPVRAAEIGISSSNIIAEPCKRNTLGAIVYITAHVLARPDAGDPDTITLAIVTADHNVGDPAQFHQDILAAIEAAESTDALVVCGIVPTYPSTGFGYVQTGAALPDRPDVFEVRAFREKPSYEQAQDFLATGGYFWNSGMFFWNVAAFLRELERIRPETFAILMTIVDVLRQGEPERAAALFATLEDISIDYAVMEHAKRVLMTPGQFGWNDIGSWPALDTVLPHDVRGNAVSGDPILMNCDGCVVYNEAGAEAMAVGVIGVRDLVVVATRDAVLVVPKDRAQDVRYLVNEIKRRNLPHL